MPRDTARGRDRGRGKGGDGVRTPRRGAAADEPGTRAGLRAMAWRAVALTLLAVVPAAVDPRASVVLVLPLAVWVSLAGLARTLRAGRWEVRSTVRLPPNALVGGSGIWLALRDPVSGRAEVFIPMGWPWRQRLAGPGRQGKLWWCPRRGRWGVVSLPGGGGPVRVRMIGGRMRAFGLREAERLGFPALLTPAQELPPGVRRRQPGPRG
ncbi:hypothetical protein [Streptomyces subrutilus]|uniref:hypothetical protein n=1 Tax=Streptomyces subrutilus TaxID=36818 RepID=UPI00340D19A7